MKKHRRKPTAYIIHILGVLTKPQRRHAVIYLLGLIWLVKFRSINRVAQEFGHKDADGLQHFMRHSTQVSHEAQEASRAYIGRQISGEDAVLIIDDMPVALKMSLKAK